MAVLDMALGEKAAADRAAVAACYASLGHALDVALDATEAAIDRCVLDPAMHLSGRAGAKAARRRDILTIRSAHARNEISLRARVIGGRPDLVLRPVGGARVPCEAFAEWLADRGFDTRALASGGNAFLDANAAAIPLAPGTIADARGLCAALMAAFGLAPLAEPAAIPMPVSVAHAWRRGRLPVSRALAMLTGVSDGTWSVDCVLADDAGEPVAILRGVSFAGDWHERTIFDPDAILAAGPDAAETMLLHALSARAAALLEMDADEVPADRPLTELGFDSLAAAELRAHAGMALGIDIPIERLTRATTLRDVAHVAAQELARVYGAPDDAFGVARHLNPAMARRLRAGHLDRAYVTGSGSILRDSEGREVIDFVAQYGALPFGHNPAPIWDALNAVRENQMPVMASLSLPVAAARLAERLTSLAPPALNRAFFCSSGAEAVEAAVKLCRAATGRPGVLSTTGGYHGLTLGALSVTGRAAYRDPFGPLLPGFDKIPFGDIAALRDALSRHPDRYAAFIVEPIQGEGGIVEAPAGYLATAGALCAAHGVAFVLDEVQTGLGRCGALFAGIEGGAAPDVVVLAKALGGGLVPMGAILYRDDLATDAFMLRHGSTFANNALGCAAATATLDRLTADGNRLMRQVAERGAIVKAKLQAIRARHPDIVRDVRGRGYLLGVSFSTDPADYAGSLASVLCRSESFGMLLASYLLDRHGVRVAPAMGQASVMRVEPALDIPPALFERLTGGIDALAEALDRGDSPAVFGHVLGLDPRAWTTFTDRRTRVKRLPPAAGDRDGRFAFLIHLMGMGDLERFDPSLAGLPPNALSEARDVVPDLLEPAVLTTVELTAPDGRRAVGDLIVVPHTAQELVDMPHTRAHGVIGDAVALAIGRGAQVVGLGGFTSVVTAGGRTLAPDMVPLTTGNALTALTAVQGIDAALAASGRAPESATAMIFGGFGSIGSAMTKLLARRVGRLCLVVRDEDAAAIAARTQALRASILADIAARASALPPDCAAAALMEDPSRDDVLVVTADPRPYWPACHVVVTATSALGHLVNATDLAPGAIVCDVSRPINVSREIALLRPDVILIEGGIVRPPAPFDCGFDLGVGRDRAYACMAETMLLALERDPARGTVGQDIDMAKLPWLEAAARRAAFALSGWSGFDRVPP